MRGRWWGYPGLRLGGIDSDRWERVRRGVGVAMRIQVEENRGTMTRKRRDQYGTGAEQGR